MADERFFDEFAEDFFAESTEHLETVRRILLALEDAATSGATAPAIDSAALMRALHTLKGLCGMVGLSDGASIAHGMEEVLKAYDVEHALPGTDTLQLLFDAAAVLDRCLIAYRVGSSAPDVTAMLRQLNEPTKPKAVRRLRIPT